MSFGGRRSAVGCRLSAVGPRDRLATGHYTVTVPVTVPATVPVMINSYASYR